MAGPVINDPNGPQTPQPKPPKKVTYGTQGAKTGVAKADQARNQAGFVPLGQRDGEPNVPGTPNPKPDDPNGPQTPMPGLPGGPADPLNPGNFLQTLKPAQQKKVQALLGDSYDPSKPLNTQLFAARWESMNPQERKAWADHQSGPNSNWLLEGAKMNTVKQVKDAYQQMLDETNSVKQQDYNDLYATMSGGGTGGTSGIPISGPAWSQGEVDAMRASLQATMAANPDFATADQMASFENSWAQGQKQYQLAAKMGARLQHLAAQLGVTPDKILPPDITERLAKASLGYDSNGHPLSNIPSAADLARYPGLATAYAGLPHLTIEEARNAWKDAGGRAANPLDRGSTGRDETQSAQAKDNVAYGDGPATMIYQPMFSSDELAAEYI